MGEVVKKDWSELYSGQHFLADPLVLDATIVHGFKRGSKELGIPTANLNMAELGTVGDDLNTGIYFGHANLKGSRYIAVVSIGWNPYYKNEKKTIEAHLIANLEDFYDERLSLTLVGFLRSEANFASLDELISCIRSDIDRSIEALKGL
jgi:riboflavin kinase